CICTDDEKIFECGYQKVLALAKNSGPAWSDVAGNACLKDQLRKHYQANNAIAAVKNAPMARCQWLLTNYTNDHGFYKKILECKSRGGPESPPKVFECAFEKLGKWAAQTGWTDVANNACLKDLLQKHAETRRGTEEVATFNGSI